MNPIAEKVATLWPEMAMLIGATVCLVTGLAPKADTRRATVWVAGMTLIVAFLLTLVPVTATSGVGLANMAVFVKAAVCGVGLILLLVAAHVPSELKQTLDAEAAIDREPASASGAGGADFGTLMRGEFFAFFLVSLTGVMLTAGADDLVWLFLALELTSLPTYVMVATSRERIDAQESAIKYFFLGAMSAAVFLYGFALLYGASGSTEFGAIRDFAFENPTDSMLMLGLVLSIVGICFKIAAVPMHFYAADVYEGATTPVTAFLAFVPKTAGFVALLLVCGLVGWPLPQPLAVLLATLAVLTMTVGNVLGLVQRNVKRVLAYSSVAHSGYVLIGVLIGPAALAGAAGGKVIGNGAAAVLFYLLAYGFATIAAFAVLAALRVRGDEAQTYDDLKGLIKRHPALAAVMVVSMLSLLGLPPMVGFLGKIYLFGSAYTQGYIVLVVIAVINSAISAGYYLPIASACIFGDSREPVEKVDSPAREAGAILAAIIAVVLGVAGGWLVDDAARAGDVAEVSNQATTPLTLIEISRESR